MARVARIAGGSSLVVAGIFMLALPGPGILTIIGGLALLSKDVPAAGRLADWAKSKFSSEGGNPAPDDTKPNHLGDPPS